MPAMFGKREAAAAQPHRRSVLRDVIEFLQQHRKPGGRHSLAEIEKHVGVKLTSKGYVGVLGRLRAHERIKIIGDGFRYKPLIDNVFERTQLQDVIGRTVQGLRRSALEDAYIGAKEDLESLQNEGKVLVIRNIEDKEDIFFPPPSVSLPMEDDIKELWRGVRMPKTEVDLDEALLRNGQITQESVRRGNTYRAQKRGMVRKKKGPRKRQKRVKKLTNQHMAGKFKWLSDLQK
mmetsp:Transcript_10899/g.19974  ORF Transcript_10899/g.19974 Transcript_10899/m.19974 type:complete len:233 (-) Transcript_10899:199-897(-)